ncbi:enoyl-CoA hydratase-related protein [Pararhodobacter sp.]|uniref:enoyl-CoA hydratase-related protein n=1 Tax=Pararhodobacter sp. TaxID=2127056 RepID=UPI002FE3A7B3
MSTITESRAGGILTLTLENGVAHPLSLGMIRALHRAVEGAQSDPETRVIVVHGPGRIFSAGHDLKEIAAHRADPDRGAAYIRDLFESCAAMMQALAGSRKPTIARVEGLATAAGLQLIAACDLAFLSESARVCLPGVKRGGFCTTPAVGVARKASRAALMELLLTGAEKSADWALRAGLATEVLPDAALAAHVAEVAETLAGRFSPISENGLAATRQQLDLPLDQAYALATEAMIGHFMDPALRDPALPGKPAAAAE